MAFTFIVRYRFIAESPTCLHFVAELKPFAQHLLHALPILKELMSGKEANTEKNLQTKPTCARMEE
jgi:hypothetical protein